MSHARFFFKIIAGATAVGASNGISMKAEIERAEKWKKQNPGKEFDIQTKLINGLPVYSFVERKEEKVNHTPRMGRGSSE